MYSSSSASFSSTSESFTAIVALGGARLAAEEGKEMVSVEPNEGLGNEGSNNDSNQEWEQRKRYAANTEEEEAQWVPRQRHNINAYSPPSDEECSPTVELKVGPNDWDEDEDSQSATVSNREHLEIEGRKTTPYNEERNNHHEEEEAQWVPRQRHNIHTYSPPSNEECSPTVELKVGPNDWDEDEEGTNSVTEKSVVESTSLQKRTSQANSSSSRHSNPHSSNTLDGEEGERGKDDQSVVPQVEGETVLSELSEALAASMQYRAGRTQLRHFILQLERENAGLREQQTKQSLQVSSLRDALHDEKTGRSSDRQRFDDELGRQKREGDDRFFQLMEQLRLVRRTAEEVMREKEGVQEEATRQKNTMKRLIESERAEKERIMREYREETEKIIGDQGREITHLRQLLERLRSEKDGAALQHQLDREEKDAILEAGRCQLKRIQEEKEVLAKRVAELQDEYASAREGSRHCGEHSAEEVQRLRQANEALERDLAATRREVQELESNQEQHEFHLLATHREERESLEGQISLLLVEREETGDIFATQLRDCRDNVHKLERELDDERRRAAEATARLRDEIHKLAEDHRVETEAMNEKVKAQERELQTHHSAASAIEERHHQSAMQLEVLAKERDGLQEALADTSSRLEQTGKECLRLRAEVEGLQVRLEEIKCQTTSLVSQHSETERDWDCRRASLESENQELQRRVTVLSQSLTAMKEQSGEQDLLQQEWQQQARVLQAQCYALEQEAWIANVLRERQDTEMQMRLELQNRAWEEGARVLESSRQLEVARRTAECRRLQDALSQAEKEVRGSAEQLKRVVEEQQRISDEHNANMETLKTQHEEDLACLERMLAELRMDLSKSQSMAAQYLKELTSVQKEKERLRIHYETEVETLEKQRDALRQELHYKEMLESEVRGTMTMLHSRLGSYEAENQSLHDEVMELTRKLQETHVLLGRKDAAVNQLRAQLRAFEARGPALSVSAAPP